MKNRWSRLVRENRSLLLFIALMIVFRSSFADWNAVPTGSMKPTILEGDRIWVNKVAYDIKVSLTDVSLYETGAPRRGDVIVFNSKAADERLVKRVIGFVPRDEIAGRSSAIVMSFDYGHYYLPRIDRFFHKL